MRWITSAEAFQTCHILTTTTALWIAGCLVSVVHQPSFSPHGQDTRIMIPSHTRFEFVLDTTNLFSGMFTISVLLFLVISANCTLPELVHPQFSEGRYYL